MAHAHTRMYKVAEGRGGVYDSGVTWWEGLREQKVFSIH